MAVGSFRRIRGAFSRSSSFRLSLLMGTALALPAAAQAENVAFNGTGDYSLTRTDTVEGGPKTIDIITNGAITLNTANVVVTSTSGNGTGIGANTTSGAGAINITSGTVTANGNSSIYGIDARSTSGNITIKSETATSQTNAASRAVYAVSNSGDITINSTTAIGTQRGIHTGALPTNSTSIGTGVTTINSILARATGGGNSGLNAIVGQGRIVNINSGEAGLTSGTGVAGAAIFVQATEAATVRSDSVFASGTNQAGVQVNSGGSSTIVSGVVSMSGNTSDAIRTAANGNVDITSDSIGVGGTNGGRGILVTANGTRTAGATTKIKSGSIDMSGSGSTGIDVTSADGVTTIESTGTIRAGQGILAYATTGATTITSNNITGVNGGISLTTGGNATVTSTSIANTGTAGAIGIEVIGDTTNPGVVTVTSGKISNNGQAINVQGTTVTVKSTEIVNTSTAGNGSGISTFSAGSTVIESGSIALNTNRNANNAGSLGGLGISMINSGTGDATITSNSIVYTGTGNSVGMTAQHTGTAGTLTINSKDVSVVGNGGYAILASSQSAAIVINSTGAVKTTGTTRAAGNSTALNNQRYADGIDAVSALGAITVNNSGSISTAGVNARGIAVDAGRAIQNFTPAGTTASAAAINVTNSGSITTTGAGTNGVNGVLVGANGINIRADGNAVTLNSTGTVKTSGNSSAGVNVTSGIDAAGNALAGTSGALTLNIASVDTAGVTANGVFAQSTTGNVTIKTGTVTTAGAGSLGVFAQTTTGNIAIDAGTTATAATAISGNATSDAVFGFSSGNGSVTVKSVNASTKADFSSAVGAVGGGAISVTSGTASTAGQRVSTVYAYNRTAAGTTIDAGTSTATGAFSYAVDGQSVGGNVTIRSGTASTTNGIGVNALAGGIADVTATTVTAGGDGQAGVFVRGGTGVKLAIGSATSTGALQQTTDISRRADAVYAEAVTGTIDATIGSAKATGANADAVRLIANGTGGAVTATITGTVSAASGNGLFIDPPGTVNVNIAAGANVSGSVAGVNVVSATQNSLVNAGTVANSGTGAAILASGKTNLTNSGTITGGSGGTAVQLGATDDTVTLRTGSVVAGAIVGGGGVDKAVLNGTGTVTSASQTVAAFTGFDNLTATAGYWTAGATASSFNSVNVANGASLEVRGAATGGLTGVVAPTYVADGTLVVRTAGNTGASVFGSQTVSGAGTVSFVGTGTATIAGTNSVTTTGGISVDNGATVVLTGTQGGKVNILSGGTFSIGNGGTTGLFTGDATATGTLIVNRSDDYTFTGALTGAGTLVKQGAGKLTLGTGYAFTGTTSILGGSIKLAGTVAPTTELDLQGTGTLDFSGTRQTVAELAGASTAASISVAQGGALTVNQTTSTAFAGAITGDGALAKTGTGTLNLTGNSTYTGATTVTGGKLAVNGSIVSPVTVSGGGKLGGTGRVGNVTIGAGGAYAPGNSIGTQNVAGNVVFAAGSTYEVETNADGRSDRIIATGTANIATNTTVAVLAEAGTYARLTSYNILSATGGVTGTFTNVTSNFAFLTPSLSYTGTAVTLRLLRNDVTFASLARTPNQLAVANAINAQGFNGAVFNAAVVLSNAATPGAYNELSGELFAAVPSVLLDQSRRIRGSVLDRADAQGEGFGIWGQAGRAGIETDATGNVAATATDRTTVLSGVDYGMGGWRVGLHAGYIDSNVGVKGRASQADVHTKLVGAYGRWSQDALTVKVGGDYSWHDVDTTRSIATAGLNGELRSGYDATSQQLFGEVSYTLLNGPVTAAPFGGLAYVRTHSDQVVETGTAAALTVASRTRDVKLATAGWHLGGSAPIGTGATLLPHLTASFQYAWGDLRGGSVAQFGGAGQAFGVSGARFAQATYGLDGGVDVQFGKNVKAGIGGFMSTSRDWSDFGANVSVSFAF